MATKSTPAERARELARAKMAERLALARATERANEKDLAAYFQHQESLQRAASTREAAVVEATRAFDAAVAKAHKTFDAATNRAHVEQGVALARMKGRGQRIGDLSELTGLAAVEVTRMLKSAEQPEIKIPHQSAPVPGPKVAETPSRVVPDDGTTPKVTIDGSPPSSVADLGGDDNSVGPVEPQCNSGPPIRDVLATF